MVKRDLVPAATIEEDHNLLRIEGISVEVGIHALTCQLLHCFVLLVSVESLMRGIERIEGRVDGCASTHESTIPGLCGIESKEHCVA